MSTLLLKPAEAASILRISRSLVYRLIADGQLASVRFGRIVRVRSEDLEQFIRRNCSGASIGYRNTGPDWGTSHD